jgi:flagellar protein FliJ
MRSGETLIRLARHRIEAVQKLVASAEKTRSDLLRRIEDLDQKGERERLAAQADPARAPTFMAFMSALQVQRANVMSSIRGVEEQIEALRGDLQTAFEERKRFEMLEERRVEREAQSRSRREQARADENVLNRFGRR